ncbi:MAG: DNA polymerase III subunit delta' [Acidobacteria bacterium]|nr:DNA polymerase III subunit delta' [Acidobacteriota bacterium]
MFDGRVREPFWGNASAVATLEQMVSTGRIPQTLLFDGPEGIGKATLARRFGAAVLGEPAKIEQDDLSRPENQERITEREKWTSEKRNEEPIFFATQSDFVTFPPDGPLRQIGMPQMRFLREQAQFAPLHGSRRVFLIDGIDRANEQAANSLLKTLEEPPAHLVIIMTATNAYDLLPTIRSRSVPVHLTPLAPDEMQNFLTTHAQVDRAERRLALANGSPGQALSIDLDLYDKRRGAMLALLKVAAGQANFGTWVKYAESISASKSEKLDELLRVLAILLEDLLLLAHGNAEIRNVDLRRDLQQLATTVTFAWIRLAVTRVEALGQLVRRNIQKAIALDALIVELSRAATTR